VATKKIKITSNSENMRSIFRASLGHGKAHYAASEAAYYLLLFQANLIKCCGKLTSVVPSRVPRFHRNRLKFGRTTALLAAAASPRYATGVTTVSRRLHISAFAGAAR